MTYKSLYPALIISSFISTVARTSKDPTAPPSSLTDGPTDGTSSGVHWMVLGLPGGGRGEHRRPLPRPSWSLSPHAPHSHSTLQ